jgi:hypothetical protein
MAKPRTKIVSKAKSAPADKPATRPAVEQESDSSSIAVLADQLWHARGCPEGSPEIDWFRAEEELSSQSIKPESPSTKRLLLTRQVGA